MQRPLAIDGKTIMKIINNKGCLTKKPKILLNFQMLQNTSYTKVTDFQMSPPLINTLFKTNSKTLLKKKNIIHNTLQKIKRKTPF